MKKDFDWHQKGVWVAYNSNGEPLLDTTSDTPYSARAALGRIHNIPHGKRHLYSIRGHKQTSAVVRAGRSPEELKWRNTH